MYHCVNILQLYFSYHHLLNPLFYTWLCPREDKLTRQCGPLDLNTHKSQNYSRIAITRWDLYINDGSLFHVSWSHGLGSMPMGPLATAYHYASTNFTSKGLIGTWKKLRDLGQKGSGGPLSVLRVTDHTLLHALPKAINPKLDFINRLTSTRKVRFFSLTLAGKTLNCTKNRLHFPALLLNSWDRTP